MDIIKKYESLIFRFNNLISNIDIILNEEEEEEKEEEVQFNFSYNKDYVNNIKHIYELKRNKNIKDNIKELHKSIFEGQSGFDLFPTPFNDAKKMLDDYLNNVVRENQTINILEPSVGVGNILTTIIDNKDEFLKYNVYVQNIDAIEYNSNIYNNIKDYYNISNFYRDDFLKFKSNKFYDVIFMNPPYSCQIELNNNYESFKQCYIIHIIKAMLINQKYRGREFVIYVICPELGKLGKYTKDDLYLNSFIGSLEDLLMVNKTFQIKLSEIFNLDYNEHEGLKLPSNQVNWLGKINDFIKLDKNGKATKLGATFYLYKIVVVS